MLIAVNAGNSRVLLGGYEEDGQVFSASIATEPKLTRDDYACKLQQVLLLYGVNVRRIHGGIVSSVVPSMVGVLEGALPLAAVNSGIRAALGALFTWKAAVLLTVIVCSVLFYRPFCKWLCPLGAFYALLNRVSLFRMQVDTHKCVSCGACAKVCKMDVDITKNPDHAECIRCGMCIKACPTGAICYRYGLGDKTQTTDKGETI